MRPEIRLTSTILFFMMLLSSALLRSFIKALRKSSPKGGRSCVAATLIVPFTVNLASSKSSCIPPIISSIVGIF